MNHIVLILFSLSFLFSSNLKSWIHERSDIINDKKYLVTFTYYMSKSKNKIDGDRKNAVYYSINKDSSVFKLDDRIILSGKKSTTTISLGSEQIFKEDKNQDFEEFKNKILSIFKDNDYKIIKTSKVDYILSLNDYFLNLDISYHKSDNLNSRINLSFFQNPYIIYVENLIIADYDSIPYSNHMWSNYEIFNLSEVK